MVSALVLAVRDCGRALLVPAGRAGPHTGWLEQALLLHLHAAVPRASACCGFSRSCQVTRILLGQLRLRDPQGDLPFVPSLDGPSASRGRCALRSEQARGPPGAG